MRKELELIEQIENYLMNKLSGADKAAFDAKMATDAGLKADVEFQQNLVEGIQRMGLKNDTINARKKYRFKNFLRGLGITLGIIGVLATAAYYYTVNTEGAWNFFGNSKTENTELTDHIEEFPPIIIPENDTLSGEANQYLDQELFEIQTGRDTVIESEEGIVVYIPANAFETENDQVDFLIQEALTPADILYAGLNTMTADGEELETGGMFYFDAFADGERIALSKELTVDIPSNPDKTGMQLYDGVENEDGELLWTNPKPFTKPLIPVEITELDFYPRGYEPKMEEWGYLNKKFKDSLYYSYADECGLDERPQEDTLTYSREDAEPMLQNVNTINVLTSNPLGMFMPLPQEDEMPNNIDDVITWDFSVSYSGDIATLTMIANQKNGWHIYSQVQPEGAIPLPTEFDFNDGNNLNKDFKLVGPTLEYGAKLSNNDGFPEKSFHGKTAKFVQKIKILSRESFDINMYYMYMACKTACLPPESRNLIININGLNGSDDLLDLGDCVECGVNPASVKTIWNSKFNNTNLATKEFEQRMPLIHQTCNNAILEVYINNLDKNLCTVDSMAARMTSGGNKRAFSNFASQGCGQVAITTNAQQKLNAYYAMKKQALQRAITKTNANFWKEEKRLNAEMSRQDMEANMRANNSEETLNYEEVQFNTAEVYAQLGLQKRRPRFTSSIVFNSNQMTNLGTMTINQNSVDQAEDLPIPTTPIRPNRPFLRANISNTGWKNIDCLMGVSLARKDAKIRGYNGRIAKIDYSSIKLSLNDATNYDRINVYVVPTKFNSYVKLQSSEGVYQYELNDKLNYSIIAIAWNNAGMFYSKMTGELGDANITLAPITKEKWEGEIKSSLGNINKMSDELNYLDYAKKDQNRKNKTSAKRDLRNKARPYVFPCKCSGEGEVVIVEDEQAMNIYFTDQGNNAADVVLSIAEIDPTFKGGARAMNTFIINNLRLPADMSPEEAGTIYVQFTVDQKGKVINPIIQRGLSERLNNEALRVVSTMSDWNPATTRGKAVAVLFTLPINIREG